MTAWFASTVGLVCRIIYWNRNRVEQYLIRAFSHLLDSFIQNDMIRRFIHSSAGPFNRLERECESEWERGGQAWRFPFSRFLLSCGWECRGNNTKYRNLLCAHRQLSPSLCPMKTESIEELCSPSSSTFSKWHDDGKRRIEWRSWLCLGLLCVCVCIQYSQSHIHWNEWEKR